MSMHRYHPDPELGDHADAILYDACIRCDQHAEQLFDLDQSHIVRLWNRMIAVETGKGVYLSENEAKACKRLWLFYLILERFSSVNPKTVFDA